MSGAFGHALLLPDMRKIAPCRIESVSRAGGIWGKLMEAAGRVFRQGRRATRPNLSPHTFEG